MSGLPEITRKRMIIALVGTMVVLAGLYFLIPKLAGLNQTWGQLKHGDPVYLIAGCVLELRHFQGVMRCEVNVVTQRDVALRQRRSG